MDLESPNTLRNLSELAASRTLTETLKKALNALTVQDKGDAEIRDTIKLRQTRPFVAKEQGYLISPKSVFNRIIGDSHFELLFARFLEDCSDVRRASLRRFDDAEREQRRGDLDGVVDVEQPGCSQRGDGLRRSVE